MMCWSCHRTDSARSARALSGSLRNRMSSRSSQYTTPQPYVAPGGSRSITVMSWPASRNFAEIAKYNPAGPPPMHTILISGLQRSAGWGGDFHLPLEKVTARDGKGYSAAPATPAAPAAVIAPIAPIVVVTAPAAPVVAATTPVVAATTPVVAATTPVVAAAFLVVSKAENFLDLHLSPSFFPGTPVQEEVHCVIRSPRGSGQTGSPIATAGTNY